MKAAFFTLDEAGDPVPCDHADAWARWFADHQHERIVCVTRIHGRIVSTVFLGLDHGWGGGAPKLFETMIFGSDYSSDGYQERYATRAEAIAGHTRAVDRVLAGVAA